MKVIGSIIARLGSKRLTYKNILPFNNEPMIGLGIKILKLAKLVDQIVVSTESELIARIAHQYNVHILQRPSELAQDNVPSIPVFQHIIHHFPADVHVNLNINFPTCHPSVIDKAIQLALKHGESLSVPYAVWAQTNHCLQNYANPWNITAHKFEDPLAGLIDIHTEDDLLHSYRHLQGPLPNWNPNNT